LTPRNIIIDKNNVPWLCDFSESNYNGSRYTDKTVLIDKLKYRSPEMDQGERLDYRSDIYQFGVILSEFLFFIRQNDSARGRLFEIATKATKEKPDERFQSVSEIIALLNKITN
jgi:serine/threonine protein kinase